MKILALLLSLALLPLAAQTPERGREREVRTPAAREAHLREQWANPESRSRWGGRRSNRLERFVSPSEYERMGLWRLDEGEQALLLDLLEDLARPTPPPPEPTVFKSRIEGRWRGFEEGVQIPLVNGQVWQQVEKRTWELNFANEPRITIQLSDDGAWYAEVEGLRKRVRVKRIK